MLAKLFLCISEDTGDIYSFFVFLKVMQLCLFKLILFKATNTKCIDCTTIPYLDLFLFFFFLVPSVFLFPHFKSFPE